MLKKSPYGDFFGMWNSIPYGGNLKNLKKHWYDRDFLLVLDTVKQKQEVVIEHLHQVLQSGRCCLAPSESGGSALRPLTYSIEHCHSGI